MKPEHVETCKLSQNISLVALHRLVYDLSRKFAYLKIEIVEFGRFGPFLGFFSIFFDFGHTNGRWSLTIEPETWAGLKK